MININQSNNGHELTTRIPFTADKRGQPSLNAILCNETDYFHNIIISTCRDDRNNRDHGMIVDYYLFRALFAGYPQLLTVDTHDCPSMDWRYANYSLSHELRIMVISHVFSR